MGADLDAAAIAARFGLGTGARIDGPPERGELGAVWPLRTDCGRWAVKRGNERLDVAEVETTTAVQDAAIANGVLSPAAVRTVDGEVLADVGGSQVRVHEWFDLAPIDRALDVGVLGSTLARMHTAGAAAGAADPWFTEPITTSQWNSLLATAADAPFADDLAGHRDSLADAAAEVAAPRTLRACHRDLFAENVRAVDGGRIAVFDWDSAGAADPGHELAMVLWEYCRDEPAQAPGLYASYREAGGPGRIEGPASFSMMICIASRLLHRSCRIWLDPASSPAEREVRESEIAEWIRDPCTRPVIDTLLAALEG